MSLADMQVALDWIDRLMDATGPFDSRMNRTMLVRLNHVYNNAKNTYPESLQEMRDALETQIVFYSLREGSFAIFQQEQLKKI